MNWSLTRVTDPAEEPLSLDDVKAHSRVDFEDEDGLITGMMVAARAYVEEYLSRSLITQAWELGLPCFPAADRICLPRGPVQEVQSITYYDSTLAAHTMAEGTDFLVDSNSELAEIVLPFGHVWPQLVLSTSRPVVIRYTAGYGDDASDIPTPILLSMKQLVGSWYENRETYTTARTAQAVVSYPFAFELLLATYRLRYPGPFPRI